RDIRVAEPDPAHPALGVRPEPAEVGEPLVDPGAVDPPHGPPGRLPTEARHEPRHHRGPDEITPLDHGIDRDNRPRAGRLLHPLSGYWSAISLGDPRGAVPNTARSGSGARRSRAGPIAARRRGSRRDPWRPPWPGRSGTRARRPPPRRSRLLDDCAPAPQRW